MTILFRVKQPFKIFAAVVTGIFWTCVPRSIKGPCKTFQRRGIRYVRHTSWSPGQRPLHAIYFNQGGGYTGGATLFFARDCRRYLGGGCGYASVKLALGLTNSGNHGYTAGRY